MERTTPFTLNMSSRGRHAHAQPHDSPNGPGTDTLRPDDAAPAASSRHSDSKSDRPKVPRKLHELAFTRMRARGDTGVSVLSIGKLRVGNEHYYLHTVAGGVEDYYVGRGEAPGRWLGVEAAELGLDGELMRNGWRRCWRAVTRTTVSGWSGPGRTGPRFRPDVPRAKLVSLLFGLADHDVAREVRTAHHVAVDVRSGPRNVRPAAPAGGPKVLTPSMGRAFVAAFRHRTSRAGDPHLHTHVLVANFTRSPDDRYGALDALRVYLYAKTAGYLYEAQLRDELTRRLGVQRGPVRNRIADLVGIPKTVLAGFSTRRAEIEEELTRRGVTSARAARSPRWTPSSEGLPGGPADIASPLVGPGPRGLTPDMLTAIPDRIEPNPIGKRWVDRRREMIGHNGLNTSPPATTSDLCVCFCCCWCATDSPTLPTSPPSRSSPTGPSSIPRLVTPLNTRLWPSCGSGPNGCGH